MPKKPIEIINSLKQVSSEYQRHIEKEKLKFLDKKMLGMVEFGIKSNQEDYKNKKYEIYKKLVDDYTVKRNKIHEHIKQRDQAFGKKKNVETNGHTFTIPTYDEYSNSLNAYKLILQQQSNQSIEDIFSFNTDDIFIELNNKSNAIKEMNEKLNQVTDGQSVGEPEKLKDYMNYFLWKNPYQNQLSAQEILSKRRDVHDSTFLTALVKLFRLIPTGAKLSKSIHSYFLQHPETKAILEEKKTFQLPHKGNSTIKKRNE